MIRGNNNRLRSLDVKSRAVVLEVTNVVCRVVTEAQTPGSTRRRIASDLDGRVRRFSLFEDVLYPDCV